MLYFSRLKIVAIYFIIVFLSLFSFANFLEMENDHFFSKKVNLGLDLQGGSYLLLEVDIRPIIDQNLQNKLIFLRKILKEENIKYKNLKIKEGKISFTISENKTDIFKNLFLNKDNLLNIYYNQYKSYEMDYFITDLGDLFPTENLVAITYSKFGLIEIKNLKKKNMIKK